MGINDITLGISNKGLRLLKAALRGRVITCRHVPTGEDWVLLGINFERDKVCVAGYPPTIAKLSDCENLDPDRLLSEEELIHRDKHFGKNWI